MLISKNSEPHKTEFESLLDSTHKLLTKEYSQTKILKDLEGRKFEPLVKEAMDFSAIKTPFENTIELI